ncbi:MAG: hypothetical protein IGQ88_02795 [Gloeomargaritaceae cyanobacterium C42_A2020_066]|nr:hypothetical protein [Gloeomargaritaceae cyanobacterium C42_A2020_066]
MACIQPKLRSGIGEVLKAPDERQWGQFCFARLCEAYCEVRGITGQELAHRGTVKRVVDGGGNAQSMLDVIAALDWELKLTFLKVEAEDVDLT